MYGPSGIRSHLQLVEVVAQCNLQALKQNVINVLEYLSCKVRWRSVYKKIHSTYYLRVNR